MPIIVETIGWLGSALILISLAQARPRRLHLLNIGACIVLIVYNMLIGAVPGLGLNAGLILVNLWRLRSLSREQQTEHPQGTDQTAASPADAITHPAHR